MSSTFKDLGLPPALLSALQRIGFNEPTPVQAATVPVALEGRDILATAQTGTGKTAAFAIPLLAQIYSEPGRQGIILAPTRELAAQIHEVMRPLSRPLGLHGTLVVGGESFGRQAKQLAHSTDYIIATPGRLQDHLDEGTTDLNHTQICVLDEVDRMLDMGFAPQIRRILSRLPIKRQTLLFSATLPPEISRLSASFLKNPARIQLGSTTQSHAHIEQRTVTTTQQDKSRVLLAQLQQNPTKTLVFARTQIRADRLTRLLCDHGHHAVSLHGGRSQGQRKQALERFRRGTHPILVATDLAGRGIDVQDIEWVVNFDLPENRQDYIHRIGRTGRFGRKGQALNLWVQGDHVGFRRPTASPHRR